MFSFNVFPDVPRVFNMHYKCYSVSMIPGNERDDVERGGKIIMPPSALDHLTRLNVFYPMLFKLTNKKMKRITHCGVLEFVADEGKVYLPYWMMRNLLLEEGSTVNIENVTLPVATFSRFQPQSTDFLDISNPKAVFENCLRNFACLTTGDIIGINYNNKVYELCVLETRPGPAVTIIECDMNVDFAPPIGYKEPQVNGIVDEEMAVEPDDLMPQPSGFIAFKGLGNRLDGKKKKKEASNSELASFSKPQYERGIPDYDYKIGTLQFFRHIRPGKENTKPSKEFKAFSGEGSSLRKSKK